MGRLARTLSISANDLLGTDWLHGNERDHWSGYTFTNPLSTAGVRVSADAVMRLAAAQACVRVLAETVAYLPLGMFEWIGEDTRRSARRHPLYDVLHYQPNSWQTATEYIEMSMGHAVLRGNAYSRIVGGTRGAVDQLIPMHPDRVTPEQRDDYRLLYHYINKDGKRETLLQEEVFHVRGLSNDGIAGLAQLNLGRDVFGTAIATETYGASMYRHGAQLGGILKKKSAGVWGDTARQNVEEGLRKFTGSGNAFKTMLLEEDMEWIQVGMRAKDAEFIASRKFSVTEICRIFRVPPHMIADLERSTNNNIEEQGIEFVVYTLGPWLKRWEQAIRRDLIVAPDRFFAEFNADALLRGDIMSRYSAYGIGIEKGFLTRNEVRRKENLNDINGLDTPLRPLNMGNGAEPPTEEGNADERIEHFVRAGADRLANKEITAVKKALAKHSGDALVGWCDEFYSGYAADLHNVLIIDHGRAEEFALAAKRNLLACHPDKRSAVVDRWAETRQAALTELGMMKGVYVA